MSQLEGALALGKTTLDAAKGDGTYDAYFAQYTGLAKAKGALNAIDQIGTFQQESIPHMQVSRQSQREPEISQEVQQHSRRVQRLSAMEQLQYQQI